MEKWKDVQGYEDYQVSNLGRIYSKERYVNSAVQKNGKRLKRGKMRKLQYNPHGYHFIKLHNEKSMQLVHRLVATAFIPNPDNKPFINHKNGIKTDNRVENLEWVTRQENEDHAKENGLKPAGQRNGASKLTEKDIKEIKDLIASGMMLKDIAPIFGVHWLTISRIKRGLTWQYLNN